MGGLSEPFIYVIHCVMSVCSVCLSVCLSYFCTRLPSSNRYETYIGHSCYEMFATYRFSRWKVKDQDSTRRVSTRLATCLFKECAYILYKNNPCGSDVSRPIRWSKCHRSKSRESFEDLVVFASDKGCHSLQLPRSTCSYTYFIGVFHQHGLFHEKLVAFLFVSSYWPKANMF